MLALLSLREGSFNINNEDLNEWFTLGMVVVLSFLQQLHFPQWQWMRRLERQKQTSSSKTNFSWVVLPYRPHWLFLRSKSLIWNRAVTAFHCSHLPFKKIAIFHLRRAFPVWPFSKGALPSNKRGLKRGQSLSGVYTFGVLFVSYFINPLWEMRVTLPGYGYCSHKSNATHSWSVQYFCVSKQCCGCRCCGFVTRRQMLMPVIAHGGCSNIVSVCTKSWVGAKSLACQGIKHASVLHLAFSAWCSMRGRFWGSFTWKYEGKGFSGSRMQISGDKLCDFHP